MIRSYKIRGYDLTKGQRGWQCDVAFAVHTARQDSMEEHAVRGHGRWMFSAMWNAYWIARRLIDELQARPGERATNGWEPPYESTTKGDTL